MAAPQSYKAHTRFFAPFHFVLMPLLLANLVVSIQATVHYWPYDRRIHVWSIVLAFTLILLAFTSRAMALKAQDRVIRLEERLRLAALLPAADHARIAELTPAQLIALRFASDEELPALTHKTLTQNLDPKAIKQGIVNWRADHHRV